MNKVTRQKFILVRDDLREVDKLLDSWKIEKFHSNITGSQSRCSVLLSKEVYE